MASGHSKIKVKNPVVELDGDEVGSRIILVQDDHSLGNPLLLYEIPLPSFTARNSFASGQVGLGSLMGCLGQPLRETVEAAGQANHIAVTVSLL
jgi:hypothetical protein